MHLKKETQYELMIGAVGGALGLGIGLLSKTTYITHPSLSLAIVLLLGVSVGLLNKKYKTPTIAYMTRFVQGLCLLILLVWIYTQVLHLFT